MRRTADTRKVERRELKLKKRNIEDTKDSEGNEQLAGFSKETMQLTFRDP